MLEQDRTSFGLPLEIVLKHKIPKPSKDFGKWKWKINLYDDYKHLKEKKLKQQNN